MREINHKANVTHQSNMTTITNPISKMGKKSTFKIPKTQMFQVDFIVNII